MNLFGNPLKPRHDKVVERVVQQAAHCVAGLDGLFDFVRDPSEANARRVREEEERGDEERRLLIDELNRTFVTPIDREDLFALSRAIDDVLDYAWSTVDEMVLFRLPPDAHLVQMAELLAKAAKEIHMAMQRILAHPQVASEHAVRAKQIENNVERLYRQALADLFEAEVTDFKGMLNVLKRREVYRHVSNAADRADEAANIITDVIMKVM